MSFYSRRFQIPYHISIAKLYHSKTGIFIERRNSVRTIPYQTTLGTQFRNIKVDEWYLLFDAGQNVKAEGLWIPFYIIEGLTEKEIETWLKYKVKEEERKHDRPNH